MTYFIEHDKAFVKTGGASIEASKAMVTVPDWDPSSEEAKNALRAAVTGSRLHSEADRLRFLVALGASRLNPLPICILLEQGLMQKINEKGYLNLFNAQQKKHLTTNNGGDGAVVAASCPENAQCIILHNQSEAEMKDTSIHQPTFYFCTRETIGSLCATLESSQISNLKNSGSSSTSTSNSQISSEKTSLLSQSLFSAKGGSAQITRQNWYWYCTPDLSALLGSLSKMSGDNIQAAQWLKEEPADNHAHNSDQGTHRVKDVTADNHDNQTNNSGQSTSRCRQNCCNIF